MLLIKRSPRRFTPRDDMESRHFGTKPKKQLTCFFLYDENSFFEEEEEEIKELRLQKKPRIKHLLSIKSTTLKSRDIFHLRKPKFL